MTTRGSTRISIVFTNQLTNMNSVLRSFAVVFIYSCFYNNYVDGYRPIKGIPILYKSNPGYCVPTHFPCGDEWCLHRSLVCNGQKDCPTGNDETTKLCKNIRCYDNTFKCDYGGCIPQKKICDGFPDCADGSDEYLQLCEQSSIDLEQDLVGNASTNEKRMEPPVGCTVPEEPYRGVYNQEYTAIRNDSGKITVPTNTSLTFSCDRGFWPNGPIMCLENNTWSNQPYCRVRASLSSSINSEGIVQRTTSCETNTLISTNTVSGGCVIPDQPANGEFTLNGAKRSVSKITPKKSNLVYVCNRDFVLTPLYARIVTCSENSTWVPEIPRCVESCDASLSYSSDGRSDECQSSNVNSFLTTVSVGDGTRQVITLGACGIQTPKFQPLIVKGSDAHAPDFPWNVAIYRLNVEFRDDFGHTHICGGTIISERLVVSAAHCFFSESTKSVNEMFNYFVGAGKLYRSWDAPLQQDPYQQLRRVAEVIIPDEYKGVESSFLSDIALLILNKQNMIMFNDVVRPACIDWTNLYENEALQENARGVVSGWGKAELHADTGSEILQQVEVPYVPNTKCFNSTDREELRKYYLQPDKICGGFKNGSSVCQGDSGSGLMFRHKSNGLWYLRGLVSFGANLDGTCDPYSYTLFTSISFHLNWIRQYINVVRDGCQLPSQPFNGRYIVISHLRRRHLYVPINTGITFVCNNGYSVSPSYSSTIYCKGNNRWTAEVPQCLINCPRLSSDSLEIKYTVPTGEPLIPGTVANFYCKDSFDIPDNVPDYWQVTCRPDGKWDNELFDCKPTCGFASPRIPSKIVNNTDIQAVDFPWNVAVYSLNVEERNSVHTFECSGVIVNNKYVIVEAQCVRKENPCTYVFYVGAGKVYKDWYAPIDKDPNQQLRKVSRIYFPESENEIRDLRDIALLNIKYSLDPPDDPDEVFNFGVIRPICVDWNNALSAEKRNKTEIPTAIIGWNLKGQSDVLQYLELPPYNFLEHDHNRKCVGSKYILIQKHENGFWYARALATYNSTTREVCIISTIFSRINFLRENIYSWIEGCQYPRQFDNGRLILENVKNDAAFLHRASIATVMNTVCRPPYKIYPPSSIYVTCTNNNFTWVPEIPSCIVQCPALSSATLDISYSISPGEPIVPGTVANLKCKDAYNAPQDGMPFSNVTCLENGFWSKPLFNCTNKCGLPSQDLKILSGSPDESAPDFPWNVAVYRINITESNPQFLYICGGTLISERLIISAAACFILRSNPAARLDFNFFAGAGKIYRSRNASSEQDPYQQIRKVSEVIFHGEYMIENGFVYNDLALLRIDPTDEFTLNSNVLPACINFNTFYGNLDVPFEEGKMVSWGRTQFLQWTEKSQKNSLTTVPKSQCNNSEASENYLFADKICLAFSENDICSSVTGSGVVHQRDDLWYLGAVSVRHGQLGTRCGINYKFEAFSSILFYIEWIQQYI